LAAASKLRLARSSCFRAKAFHCSISAWAFSASAFPSVGSPVSDASLDCWLACPVDGSAVSSCVLAIAALGTNQGVVRLAQLSLPTDAACSVGKWPRARTARRYRALIDSTAFVLEMTLRISTS
jgi:hypothetical protein